MFWVLAAIALAAGAFFTLLPLFRKQSAWKPAGVVLLLAIPALALWLYSHVGNPLAMESGPPAASESQSVQQEHADMDMGNMIARLEARLAQNPNDPDGWILLARSYNATQRTEQATRTLESALEMAPDDPKIMAELAEIRINASPPGQLDSRVLPMLGRVLETDPTQLKAIWLLGNAQARAGNDRAAIGHWESVLASMEPGRTIAGTIQKQISDARTRLGLADTESPGSSEPAATPEPGMPDENTPQAASPEAASPEGINVSLSTNNPEFGNLPATSVLFVIVRPAGTSAGPPLGVRRINQPTLPMELTLTDRDSMMPNRAISSVPSVTLQARISLSGSPAASSGDWQSAAVTVNTGEGGSIALELNERVE